jgi:cytochrome c553
MSSESAFPRSAQSIIVAIVAGLILFGFGVGFLLLQRRHDDRGSASAMDTIHHSLGLHRHSKSFNSVQPAPKVPSSVVWDQPNMQRASSGDPKRGEFIALNCTYCHIELSRTSDSWVPNLAGLDALVTYKQLDDFRSGTRLSGPMSAIAESLSAQDYADVAAYFASQPGLPTNSGRRALRSDSGFHNSDPIQKLIFAGDPKRGIAACANCHGPGGYLIGAPALINQNPLYLEQQLQAFAQGARSNDMNMPMRTIAGLLTPAEMKSLASAYSKGLEGLE